MRVEFPYPPRALSPNKSSPGNWWEKARAAKTYKTGCGWECKTQGVKPIAAEKLAVRVTFHPPNARPRDLDNALASIKAGLDALSAALGVDDSKWTIQPIMGEPRPKLGRVVVEWEAA